MIGRCAHILPDKGGGNMRKRNQHRNARLTPKVRREMVARPENGEVNQGRAGRIYGIHRNTVAKWVKEIEGTGNWLCLDKTNCPEKHRVSSALKRLTRVEQRVQKGWSAIDCDMGEGSSRRVSS